MGEVTTEGELQRLERVRTVKYESLSVYENVRQTTIGFFQTTTITRKLEFSCMGSTGVISVLTGIPVLGVEYNPYNVIP